MNHRIYLASPTEHQERAHAIGLALVTELGDAEVVSTWHASPKAKYPPSAAERSACLAGNLSQIDRATVAVFLMDLGKPQTTLAELGYTVARGIPVVMTKSEYSWQRSLFDAHGSVTVVPVWGMPMAGLVDRIASAIEAWASVTRASQRASGVR